MWDKLKQWFLDSIVYFQRRRLKHKIMITQIELARSGEWELSFTLCHMILRFITPALLNDVRRIDEENTEVNLAVWDIDVILNHLDEVHQYLDHEIKKRKGEWVSVNKPRPLIKTNQYPDEVQTYSLGRLLGMTGKHYSAKQLHAILLGKFELIVDLDYTDHLPAASISYVNRMSTCILADCFALTIGLMGLALHEQQIGQTRE